jgi:DNA-binding transcriptional MerR regulator
VADKAPGAFKTIGELSTELGVAQHIPRYWETRFPQLKPLQRAGNRRYYRPADVELARRIHRLLNQEGYTVRGVQKVLRDKAGTADLPEQPIQEAPAPAIQTRPALDIAALRRIRDNLSQALEA